jgi:predicted glutamine amidotransferase
MMIDNQPAATSPIAELIKRYPIKSRNVIAHIRKATQGVVQLENCHPFLRELWGRHWIFAHNGDLIDADMSVDFSETNKPGDCVSVIATEPLTSNETWTAFGEGELIMFENGLPKLSATVPIPDAIRRRNAERGCVVREAETTARAAMSNRPR